VPDPTVPTSSQAAARGPAVVEPLPAARTTRKRAHESVGIDIDSDWRVASWRDKVVSLSPLEHDLLRCLLGDLGRTLTFERLHRQVWGNDHLGGRSDLQSVVKRLRRKLRDLGSPLQIHAVRGVGLRLTDLRALPAAIALRSSGSGSLDDLPA
jgi:DNA-binding response OmpR family regulator